MSIVYTAREKCKGCFACVRDCPAKAIKVEEGLAQVMKERCIACGNCLKVCATGAKRVESDIGLVWQLLGGSAPVVAVMSPSFPAAMPELRPGQLVNSLRRLGFSEVMEDAFGAELVVGAYARLLAQERPRPLLSSNCPAVVSYIEKYHPGLLANLAPVASPMVAMGRLIKQRFDPRAKVVFIGPCIGKKAEARDERVAGLVDGVLTFAELKEMLAAKNILPTEEESAFGGPKPNLGRLFSASGGLLKVLGLPDDIQRSDVVSVHGPDYMVKILRECAAGEITARFVNLYFCHGCLDGPVIESRLSGFRRKQLVAAYTAANADPAQTERDLRQYADLDLERHFTVNTVPWKAPSERDVQSVLEQMGKTSPEDQYNCGACGYPKCRDLAEAVCAGLAEIDMCWPYLLKKLQTTQDSLIQVEKLTSLGQMAASIAHEINNPLAGVLVYDQLLTKKISTGKATKELSLEYLAKMESELLRTTRMVRNLLDFARQSAPRVSEIDINEIMQRGLELGDHSAVLQNVTVVKQLAPNLPQPMADADQIQQVCTNLIMNAIQAMPQGGTLTVRTSADAAYLKVEVQDTGVGIPPENMRKLFTPFFTTKREVKGVGLGLAVSYGIIQRHQGRIEVDSQAGRGSTFTVYLPLKHDEKN